MDVGRGDRSSSRPSPPVRISRASARPANGARRGALGGLDCDPSSLPALRHSVCGLARRCLARRTARTTGLAQAQGYCVHRRWCTHAVARRACRDDSDRSASREACAPEGCHAWLLGRRLAHVARRSAGLASGCAATCNRLRPRCLRGHFSLVWHNRSTAWRAALPAGFGCQQLGCGRIISGRRCRCAFVVAADEP